MSVLCWRGRIVGAFGQGSFENLLPATWAAHYSGIRGLGNSADYLFVILIFHTRLVPRSASRGLCALHHKTPKTNWDRGSLKPCLIPVDHIQFANLHSLCGDLGGGRRKILDVGAMLGLGLVSPPGRPGARSFGLAGIRPERTYSCMLWIQVSEATPSNSACTSARPLSR